MQKQMNEKPLAGWFSDDQKEIRIRKKRGEKENFSLEFIEPSHKLFGTYIVYSSLGIKYFVEIRSFENLENSCSCPDFLVNELGTCKHIENVIFQLKKKFKNKFEDFMKKGSSRTEIYLEKGKIKVKWPRQICNKTFAVLDPFFSSDRLLLTNPISGIEAIKNILQKDSNISKKVRISRFLTDFLEKQKKIEKKKEAKEKFLNDVKQKKRSLDFLKYPLYNYQKEGMMHLAFREKAILADEMGLGKTIQAIAACELLKKLRDVKRVLVISPASLKSEWEEQINKFTDLSSLVIQGNKGNRLKFLRKDSFFYLTSYEQIRNDFEEIQTILVPDIIILDEAQRIKNWQTKTAWAVKQLKSEYVFVLTGTPIENRIDEIYSITQMIDPHIFGPLFRFNEKFYQLNEKGKPIGYKNLNILHKSLNPVLLRRLKEDVEDDLPQRTINNYFVEMEKEQRLRYEEYNNLLARLLSILKKRALTKEEMQKVQRYLACMRMLCDSPYILDDECKICPKLKELKQILMELMASNNKIIIFSEWERMLFLIRELVDDMGIKYSWHTGSISQNKRREQINLFKNDENCRLFLSTDSGSVGLNLQVANVVINMDLPWNPAKLEQRVARSWRKYQKHVVQMINIICEDSIEHRMLNVLAQKKILSNTILDGENITEMKIPSGRISFLERLEDIMGYKIKKEDEKKSFKEDLKKEIKIELLEKLNLLEIYKDEEGKEIIFIVVDQIDEKVNEKVEKCVRKNCSSLSKIELLDKKTFLSIQNLIKQGILKMEAEKETLFQASIFEKSLKDIKRKKIKKAQKDFLIIQRKMKMANVLADGGFPEEAFSPGIKAFKEGERLFNSLQIEDNLLKKQKYEIFSKINGKINDQKEIFKNLKNIELFLNNLEEMLTKQMLI